MALLLQRLAQAPDEAALVFNCQVHSCTAGHKLPARQAAALRQGSLTQQQAAASTYSATTELADCWQMGRGRTTTGMIIATMLLLRRRKPQLQLLPKRQGVSRCACIVLRSKLPALQGPYRGALAHSGLHLWLSYLLLNLVTRPPLCCCCCC